MYLNKIVIAADSNTGPSEILDHSTRGFLFKNDDWRSLAEKFFEFYNSSEDILYKKKIKMKKYCRNFTFFSHYRCIKKIFY